MVIPPRRHPGNVDLGGLLFKRQSSTCTNECTASSNLLTNSSDPYVFCTKEYFDSYQGCLNCLGSFPFFDESYFNQLIQSFDSIVDSCNTLGRPISNSLTVPPLAATVSTTAGTHAGSMPTGIIAPTGPNTVKSTGTNPAAAGSEPTDKNINQDSAGAPIGVIVGGVIGGVAVIAGIILAIFFLKRRNRASGGSPNAALIPDGHVDYETQAVITPFQYPVPQSTGTPPQPQMQQYNANPYAPSQHDAASSHHHLPAQHQFGRHSDVSSNQRLGGFVGPIAGQDHNTSTYAPSSFSAGSDGPYQPALSPGGVSSGTSAGVSQLLHSPSLSSHSSSSPLLLPPQPSRTTKGPQPQPQVPPVPPLPFDSPPAYDDAPTGQPEMPAQASASAPQPLSAAEVELISQRVATLINNGGGPADRPPKKS